MVTIHLDSRPLPVLLYPPRWGSDRLWTGRKFSENWNFGRSHHLRLYAPQSRAVVWGQGAECVPLGVPYIDIEPLHSFEFEVHVDHCPDRC